MAWMKNSEAFFRVAALLVRGRVHFDFDGIPMRAEGLPIRKRMNLVRCGIDSVLRRNRLRSLPPLIQVEPTNLCNLECPLCPTGSKSMRRERGFMSLETFEKIMDDLGDVLITVYLFGYGEPFMNEDLPGMIKACTDRGILTLTSTNGHFLQTLDDALSVVDAGLTTLIVAVDGSTQEIYQSYRRSGDLGKATRCASLIEEAKVRRGSPFPYTALRSVVTRENESDLPNLERLACDLGVNMFTYKSLGCMTQSEEFGEYEPSAGNMRRFEYSGPSRITRPLVRCPFPFRQPSVFWDGTVVGSEHDYEKEMPFGRIGEKSFPEIWNGPQALRLRQSIREGRGRPAFCDACPHQDLSQRGVELSCRELRGASTAPRAS